MIMFSMVKNIDKVPTPDKNHARLVPEPELAATWASALSHMLVKGLELAQEATLTT